MNKTGQCCNIHTKKNLECKIMAKISKGKCEMIAINIVPLNTINIVAYRPPKTNGEDFNHILNKIEDILSNMTKPEPTVILTGDFNFPFVKWKVNSYNGCISEIETNNNESKDEKTQFMRLCSIKNQYNMIQAINGTTREENGKKSTLDLIYTNDISLFTEIEITPSNMSDHHLIEVSTSYHNTTNSEAPNKEKEKGMRIYNFYSKEIVWDEVNKQIEMVTWEENRKKTKKL